MNSLIRNVKSIPIPALQTIARKTTPSLSSLDSSRCSSPEIQFRSRSLPPLDKPFRSFATFSSLSFNPTDAFREVKASKAPTLKILSKFRRTLTQKYMKKEVKKPKKGFIRDSKCQEVCINPCNDKVKKSNTLSGPQRSFHDYRLLETPTSSKVPSYQYRSKEFSLMSSKLRSTNQNANNPGTIKNLLKLNEKVRGEKQKKDVIEKQCKNKVNYFYLENYERSDCKQCSSKNKKRIEEFNKKNSTKLHNKTSKQQNRSYSTRSNNPRITQHFVKKVSKGNRQSARSFQEKPAIQVKDHNVDNKSEDAVTLYNLIKIKTSKKYIPDNPVNKYKFESKKRPDTYEFDRKPSDAISYAPEIAKKVNPVLIPNASQNNRLVSVMNRNSSSPFLQRKIASKEVIENFSNLNPSNFGTKGTHSYPVLIKKIVKDESPQHQKKWAPKVSQEKVQLYVEQCRIQELILKKSQSISSTPTVDPKVNVVKASLTKDTAKDGSQETRQSEDKEVFFIHHKDDLNNRINKELDTTPKVELAEQSKEQLAQAIRNMIQPVIQKEVLKYDEVKTALERMERNLEFCLEKLNLPKSQSVGQISKYDLNWVLKKDKIEEINTNPEMKEPLVEKSKPQDPIRRNPLSAPSNSKVELFNDPLNERNILTSFTNHDISKYDPCNTRDKKKDYVRKRRGTGGDRGGESSGNQNVTFFKKSSVDDSVKDDHVYLSKKSNSVDCQKPKTNSRDGFPMIESKCKGRKTSTQANKDCSPDIKTKEMCEPKPIKCKMQVDLCEKEPQCSSTKVDVVSFETTEPCCCEPRDPCTQGKEDDICPKPCFKVNDPEKRIDYCSGPGCKNPQKATSAGPANNPLLPKKASPQASAESVLMFDKKQSDKKNDKFEKKRMPCKIQVPEKPCDPCNPTPKKPPCYKKDPCKTAPKEETPVVKLFDREKDAAKFDVLDFNENHKIDFHGSETLEKNYLLSNNPDRSDCPKRKGKPPCSSTKIKEEDDACVKKPEKKPCKEDPCKGKLKRPKKLSESAQEEFILFQEGNSVQNNEEPFSYLAPNDPDRSDCPRRKKKIPCREKLKWPKEKEPCGPPPKPPCKEDPCKGKIKRKASEIDTPEHLVLHENENIDELYTSLAPNNPDRSDCPRKRKKIPCRERLKWPKEEEPCGPPKKPPCKKDPCKDKKWASETNLEDFVIFAANNKSGNRDEKKKMPCKVEVPKKKPDKCHPEPPKPPCDKKDPCKMSDNDNSGCQRRCEDNICRKPPCSEDTSRISPKEVECNKSKIPIVRTKQCTADERYEDYCKQFPMPEDCGFKIQPHKVPKVAPPQCLQTACKVEKPCSTKTEHIACSKRVVDHGFEGMKEPCKPDYKKQDPCPECEKECVDLPEKYEPIFHKPKVDDCDLKTQMDRSDPEQSENDKRYCGGNFIDIHDEPRTENTKKIETFNPPIQSNECNTQAKFEGPSKSSWNPVKIESDKMEDSKTLKSKSKSNIDLGKKPDSLPKPRQKTQAKTIKASITTPNGSKTMMETVSDLCMLIIRKGKGGKKAAPIVVTLARSEPDFYAFGTPSSGIGLMGSSGSGGGGRRGKDPFDIQRASLFGWGKNKKKTNDAKKKEKYPWTNKDACLSKKPKKSKDDCGKSRKPEKCQESGKADDDPYVCVKNRKGKGKKDDCKPKADPCKKKEDPCKDLNKAITGSTKDPCKSNKGGLGDKTKRIIDSKKDSCKDVRPPPKKEDPCKKKDDPCKKKEDSCMKKEDPCKKKEDDICPKKKEDPCKKQEDSCQSNKKGGDDFCKKKEDPCKKKEDPCKKKEDDICPKKCMDPSTRKKIEDPSCNLKSSYQLAQDKFRPRSMSFCSDKKAEASRSCSDGNRPKKSESWTHVDDVNVCFKTPAQIVDATPIPKCIRMEVIDFKTPAQIVDEKIKSKCVRIESNKAKLKNRYPWNGPCKGCLKDKTCFLSQHSEALADEKLCLEKSVSKLGAKLLTKVVECPKKPDESSSCKKPVDICQKTREDFKRKKDEQSKKQNSVKKCMEYAIEKKKLESCKDSKEGKPPNKTCADSKKPTVICCSMVDLPNNMVSQLQAAELPKDNELKSKTVEEKTSKYTQASADNANKYVAKNNNVSLQVEDKSASSTKSIDERNERVKDLFARLELIYAELDRKIKFDNEKHSIIPTQPQFKTCDLVSQNASPLEVRDTATNYDHNVIQFYMDYLKMLGVSKNPTQVPCQANTSVSDTVFQTLCAPAQMNVEETESSFDQAALEFYLDYLKMLEITQTTDQVSAQAERVAADIVSNITGTLDINDLDHKIDNADIEFYFDYLKMLDRGELAERSPTQSKITISKLVSEEKKQTLFEALQSNTENEYLTLEFLSDYYQALKTSKTLNQLPIQPKNSTSDALTRTYKDKTQLDLSEDRVRMQELEDGEDKCCYLTANSMMSDHMEAYHQELIKEEEFEKNVYRLPGLSENEMELERGDKTPPQENVEENTPLSEKEYEVVHFLKSGLDTKVIQEEMYTLKVLSQESPNFNKSSSEINNQINPNLSKSKTEHTIEDEAKVFRREGAVLKEPIHEKSFKDMVFIPENNYKGDHVSKELVFQAEVYRPEVVANIIPANYVSYTKPKEMDTILSTVYKKPPFEGLLEDVAASEKKESLTYIDNMLPKSIDDVIYQFHQTTKEAEIIKTDISREIFDAHTKTQLFSYDLSENIAQISDVQENLNDSLIPKELSNVLSDVYQKPLYDVSTLEELKLAKQKETLKGKSFEEISEIFQIQKTLSEFLTEAFKKSERMSEEVQSVVNRNETSINIVEAQSLHEENEKDYSNDEFLKKKSVCGKEKSAFAKKILQKTGEDTEDPYGNIKKQKIMTSAKKDQNACSSQKKEPCIPCKHEDYTNRYKRKECGQKITAAPKKGQDPCNKDGSDKKKEPCIPCKHEDYSNRYKKKDDCGTSQTKKKEDPCQKKCEELQDKNPEKLILCKSNEASVSKSRSTLKTGFRPPRAFSKERSSRIGNKKCVGKEKKQPESKSNAVKSCRSRGSIKTGFRPPRGSSNERSNSYGNDKCRKVVEFIKSRERDPSTEPRFKTPAQVVDESGGGKANSLKSKPKAPPVLCYTPPPKITKGFLSMKEQAAKARMSALQAKKPDPCKKDQSLQKICLAGTRANPGESTSPAGDEYDLAKAIKDKFKQNPNINEVMDNYVNKLKPRTAPEKCREVTALEKEKLSQDLCQESLDLLKQNLRKIKKQDTDNCNQRLAKRKIARDSNDPPTSQVKSQPHLNMSQASKQGPVDKKSSASHMQMDTAAGIEPKRKMAPESKDTPTSQAKSQPHLNKSQAPKQSPVVEKSGASHMQMESSADIQQVSQTALKILLVDVAEKKENQPLTAVKEPRVIRHKQNVEEISLVADDGQKPKQQDQVAQKRILVEAKGQKIEQQNPTGKTISLNDVQEIKSAGKMSLDATESHIPMQRNQTSAEKSKTAPAFRDVKTTEQKFEKKLEDSDVLVKMLEQQKEIPPKSIEKEPSKSIRIVLADLPKYTEHVSPNDAEVNEKKSNNQKNLKKIVSPDGKFDNSHGKHAKDDDRVAKTDHDDFEAWQKIVSKYSEFSTKGNKPTITTDIMLANSRPKDDSGGGHSEIEEALKKVNECMKKRKGKDSDVWPRKTVDKEKEKSEGDGGSKKCISAHNILANLCSKDQSGGGGGHSEIEEAMRKVNDCMKKRKGKDSDVWPRKTVDKEKEKSEGDGGSKKCISAHNIILANLCPKDHNGGGGGHSEIEEAMKKVNECMKKRKGKDSDVWPRKTVDKEKEKSEGDGGSKKCISAHNIILANLCPKDHNGGGGGHSEIEEAMKKVNECMKKRKGKDSDVWPRKTVDKEKEKSEGDGGSKKCVSANTVVSNLCPKEQSGGGGHSEVEEAMKKVNECMKKRKGKDTDVWPRKIVDKEKEKSTGDDCPKRCKSSNAALANSHPKDDCGGGGGGGGHSEVEEAMKKVNECMKKRRSKDSDVWPRKVVDKEKEKSSESDHPKKCISPNAELAELLQNNQYRRTEERDEKKLNNVVDELVQNQTGENESKLENLCNRILDKNSELTITTQNFKIPNSKSTGRPCYLDSAKSKPAKILSLCEKIQTKENSKHSTKSKVKFSTLARPYGSYRVATLLGRQINHRQVHNVRCKSTKSDDDGCPKEYQVGDSKTLFKCLKNKAKKLSKEDVCKPQKKCSENSSKVEIKDFSRFSKIFSTKKETNVCTTPKTECEVKSGSKKYQSHIEKKEFICKHTEEKRNKCNVAEKHELKKYPTHAEKKEAICKYNYKSKARNDVDLCDTVDPCKEIAQSCLKSAPRIDVCKDNKSKSPADPCERQDTPNKKSDSCLKSKPRVDFCKDDKPRAVAAHCRTDKIVDLHKQKSDDACLKTKPKVDFCKDTKSQTKTCLDAIKTVEQKNACENQDAKQALFRANLTIDPKKFTTSEATVECQSRPANLMKEDECSTKRDDLKKDCPEKCKNKTDYQLGPHASIDDSTCGCPTPNCDCFADKLLPSSTYKIEKGKDLGIQKSCMKKQKSPKEVEEAIMKNKIKSRDQGLLRQCAVMAKELSEISQNEKQILSRKEASSVSDCGENLVCKVKRLGAGEKLICTPDDKLEPKTYLSPSNCQDDSDSSVYEDAEEGVLKVLNCTIVKDEFGGEKLVCKPLKVPEGVTSEADLIKLMKKGTSGERLAKVTSNKLVCREVPLKVDGKDCLNEDGTLKTEMLCQILKVEEIRKENEPCDISTPKIKKRIRKNSFEDLTRKMQMQTGHEKNCGNLKGQK